MISRVNTLAQLEAALLNELQEKEINTVVDVQQEKTGEHSSILELRSITTDAILAAQKLRIVIRGQLLGEALAIIRVLAKFIGLAEGPNDKIRTPAQLEAVLLEELQEKGSQK